jgi:glycosyltransferase involved in cell wall biosynthesis
MDTQKRLIIIDELLQNIDGHNFEYIKSVKEIFEKKNYIVDVYGNRGVIDSIKKDIYAKPWFAFNTNPSFRKIPVFGPILFRILFWFKLKKQYGNCIKDANITSANTEIFIPNIFWYNLLPIIQCFKNSKNKVTILFRLSTAEIPDAPIFFHPIIKKIFSYTNNIVQRNSNILISTDSSVIANDWKIEYSTVMKVLPIPHIKPASNEFIDRIPRNRMAFYAPGVMRLEKGMELMFHAFKKIDSTNIELANKIEWILQIFGNRDKEIFDNYRKGISLFKNIKVTILGSLSSEEYNNEMHNADVILIPYQLNKGYRARTSGVLCEAIGAKQPFITTDDTWMSAQGKEFGSGLFIKDGSEVAFIESINQLLQNHFILKFQAVEASTKFLEFHSLENFYNLYKL